MRQERKFKKSTWVVFSVLAAVVVVAFGAIGATAIKTAAAKSPDTELTAGTVIFDTTCMPVQLGEGAVVTADRGSYTLRQSDAKIPLGQHTMAYDGNGVRVFGGGYRIDTDGSVHSVKDDDVYSDFASGAIFKLADRRYLIAYSTITDSNKVFQAKDYLYISMDVVGNARLYSNNMSLKTTQPTIIEAGSIIFDIANETLTLGKQTMDLSKLIGSTNTYDSGIYKAIDDPQTPDSIDLTIRGGAGGSGGSGGAGGSAGASSSCFFILSWKPLMVLIIRNTAKAMMRKSRMVARKVPYRTATSVDASITPSAPATACLRTIFQLLKSMPPVRTEMRGMITSFTREVEILPKAPPMMTPTAMSMTLPRAMKVLNSPRKPFAFSGADIVGTS